MALSLKGAAKSGDGGKFRARKVEVGLQVDGLSKRPAIQCAVLSQALQILHGTEMDHIRFPKGKGGGRKGGKEQNPRAKKGQKSASTLFHWSTSPSV